LVLFSQIMDKISFKDIKSLKLLSGFLGTKEEEIDKYLNQNDTIFDTWIEENMPNNGTFVIGLPEDSKYRFDKMYIPKKRNKNTYRIVYKVQDEGLKSIHKIIQKYINENYNPQNCVHGFVSEKNVATNAAIHLSKKLILKLDIKDFFPTVKKQDVISCFIRLGCIPEIADVLATLITLNGELVQGFNTSPVIANMILEEMDSNILALCNKYNSDYSRYADDLYISSNTELPPTDKIISIINQKGFTVNTNKTRIMKRGHKQYVTGLTVFDNRFPRIPKKFKNRIRFSLYMLNKCGPKACLDSTVNEYDGYLICKQNLLKGWIDYVNAIEPNLAKRFYDSFNKIDWNY